MKWEQLRDVLLNTYKDIEFQGHVICKNGKWVEEIFVETNDESFYIDIEILNHSKEVDYNDFLYQL
jgi:hypothetical protein